jgi:LPS-assembly protein
VKNFDNSVDYQLMLTVNLLKLGSYGYTLYGRRR